jgi:hypothetical protein
VEGGREGEEGCKIEIQKDVPVAPTLRRGEGRRLPPRLAAAVATRRRNRGCQNLKEKRVEKVGICFRKCWCSQSQ